jgi:hypothetical protein
MQMMVASGCHGIAQERATFELISDRPGSLQIYEVLGMLEPEVQYSLEPRKIFAGVEAF